MLLCVPAAVGLLVLSREFVFVLFGERFAPAVPLARVLIVFLFLETLISIPSSILLTWEKYRYIILSRAISIVGIPLLVLGVRLGGGTGAAIVIGGLRLISQLSDNWFAFRQFDLCYPFGFLGRVAAASAVFATVLALLGVTIDVTPLRLMALTAAGALLFAGAFRMFGGLDDAERRIIESSSLPLKGLILRLT